jgi:hypothetical protein
LFLPLPLCPPLLSRRGGRNRKRGLLPPLKTNLPLSIKVFKRAIALFIILFPFPFLRGRG